MQHREKGCTDAFETERRSTDSEPLVAKADGAHENPSDQHPNRTTTPAPKAPTPQLDLMPPGWESRLTNDGKLYFIDHNRRTTTWVDPRKNEAWKLSVGLPSGWEIRQTEEGRTYFVDHHTRTTTWEAPRSTNTQSQEEPVPKPDDLPSGMGSDETQNGRTVLEGPSKPNRPRVSSPLCAKL